MTELPEKIADLLKEDSIHTELLRLGLGLCVVFVIDVLFKFDLTKVQNVESFNSVIAICIVVAISYFAARICALFGFYLNKLILFTLVNDKKSKLLKNFKKFSTYLNTDTYNPSQDDFHIKDRLEAVEFFRDSKYLRSVFDDTNRMSLISDIFTGAMFLFISLSVFIYPAIHILYIIVMFILSSINSCYQTYNHSMAARRLVKIYEQQRISGVTNDAHSQISLNTARHS